MKPEEIKAATSLTLKPNKYLIDPSIPYLYQCKGSLMMLARPRMILGDDVGLGKTLESIVAFSYMKSMKPDYRALILTEKIALSQWQNEFAWLTPGLTTKIITAETHVKPDQRVKALTKSNVDVIISTYSLIYEYGKYLKHGMGSLWVLFADEPNYFKNTDTVLYRKMYDLVNGEHGPARSYGMTATVVENRLEEAYGIFRIIAPYTFESQVQFERDYCVRKRLRQGINVTVGYKNLDKFRQQIEPFYFGRLQDDPEVKQQLPEVITKDIDIMMSVAQSRKVVESMDKLIEMPDGEVKQLMLLQALTLSQQLCNMPASAGFVDIESAKLVCLLETLENTLMGERVVIYCKFKSVINLICEEFRKKGWDYVRITGDEDTDQRVAAKERFMSDGSDRCNLMLINKAGQKAVNLQKGGHLFFFDLPWSYGWYRQIVGRLKRTGSTQKKIGVYRMLATLHPDVCALLGSNKTIDHYNLKVVQKKQKLFAAVTGDIKDIESSTSDILDVYQEIRAAYRVSQ